MHSKTRTALARQGKRRGLIHDLPKQTINDNKSMDMKRATILSSFLAASVSLFAQSEQPEENRILDFTIEYSGNTVVGMTSYAYDSNNLVKEKVHQRISPADPEAFVNDTKEIFGYDSLQREILHENYIWSDAVFDYIGNAAVDARTVKTYGSEGRTSQIEYFQWDEASASWEIHTRGIYAYDLDSSTETRYKSVNGIWQNDPYERYDFVYDADGRPVEKTVYSYMFDFMSYEYSWMPLDMTRYAYDSHGSIIQEDAYVIEVSSDQPEDPWGDDWDPWAKGSQAKGDSITLSLMYSYKHVYTYDEHGNILTQTDSTYRDYMDAYEMTNQLRYEHHYVNASDYLELPYIQPFSSETDLEGFTIEDGNKDSSTWSIADGKLQCRTATGSPEEDILYLPALHLAKDCEIRLSFHAGVADTALPAFIRVALCHNNDSNTVAEYLPDTMKIDKTELQNHTIGFIPEREGIYRVALCFSNERASTVVTADSVKVENYRSSSTPMPPYNLTAIPARDGSLQVRLGWFAPVYTLDGQYLRAVDSMEVYRAGTETPIHTTGTMNSSLETRFIDQGAAEGLNTYRIFAYADGLRSDAAEISVIAGIAAASAPRNFKAQENEDHSVLLSWNTPESAEGSITYTIVRNNARIVAEGIKDTSFTDAVDIPEGQTYVFYSIRASNEGGQGDVAVSELLFIGEASPAPFAESFAGGSSSHLWMNEIVSGIDAAWGIGSTASSPEAEPQDGDGGLASFLVLETVNAGDAVRFSSEKIDISTLKAPVLTFHLFHIETGPTEAAVIVEASRNNGRFQSLSDTIRIGGAETEGWQRHAVDLSPLAGEENLRISFLGFSDLENCIHLDNIAIDEKTSATAPANLQASVIEDSVALSWNAEEGHTYHVIVNNITTEEEVFNQSGIAYSAAEMILCLGNLDDGEYEWSVEASLEGSASNKVDGPAFRISTTINQSGRMAAIRAYPNPNQGDFWLELPGKAHVEILSLHGKCLQTIESADGIIPVSIQTPGMYIVRINDGTQVSATRIIVR